MIECRVMLWKPPRSLCFEMPASHPGTQAQQGMWKPTVQTLKAKKQQLPPFLCRYGATQMLW